MFHCGHGCSQPGHLRSFPEVTTALIGPTGRWQDRRKEDTGGGVPDASQEDIVLEWVKTFAGAMLKSDESSGDEDDASECEKEVVNLDVAPDPASKDHEEFMIKFKDVSSSTSQDLLKNVLSANMCLERANNGAHQGVCQ